YITTTCTARLRSRVPNIQVQERERSLAETSSVPFFTRAVTARASPGTSTSTRSRSPCTSVTLAIPSIATRWKGGRSMLRVVVGAGCGASRRFSVSHASPAAFTTQTTIIRGSNARFMAESENTCSTRRRPGRHGTTVRCASPPRRIQHVPVAIMPAPEVRRHGERSSPGGAMSLDRVPAGVDVPNDCNVVIEIPMHGEPIKYEVDKETDAVFVDRFMSTSMRYPCNYGYVPQTLSDD